MSIKFYKKVLLPIIVPEGNYCYGNGICCEHFSNEERQPRCNFDLEFSGETELNYNKNGMVIKPKYCKDLKENLDKN